MIEIHSGNILEAGTEAVVNTVNCVGVMGKGIALQFKQAFPENFRRYAKACKDKELAPGIMLVYPTERLINPKYIINFPTKRHWRGYSLVEDILNGLGSLVEDVDRLHIKSIAVPPLGCGNGGLDWRDIRPLIESAFATLPSVRVVLYEPYGSPASEKMPISTGKPRMTQARALFVGLIDLYRIPDYRLTLLEIQKLAYFLQSSGEPLRLRFVKHNFGPYAENLNHVLQVMEGHFMRGYGDRNGKAQIYVTPEGRWTAQQFFEQQNAEAPEKLDSIGRLINGFESPYGMELLASIHWIACHEEGCAKTDPEKAVVGMMNWSDRKRRIFDPRHIRKAWRRLRDEGWFQSPAIFNQFDSSNTPSAGTGD